MKKIMGGLRRNKNSTTNNNSNNLQQQESTTTNDDEEVVVNYADLFDNDYDENSKENNSKNNIILQRSTTTTKKTSMAMKKRKKLNPAVVSISSSREVRMMPMMTISEMVECEEEEEEVGVSSCDDDDLAMLGEKEDEDVLDDVLGEDEVSYEKTYEKRNEDEIAWSAEEIDEDCKTLHDNNVAEEFETGGGENNKVDAIITYPNIVEEEEEHEATDKVNVDKKREIVSSINEDIGNDNGCEGEEVPSSSSLSIDEQNANNDGSEEVIHKEDVNNSEAVIQQQQQVSHDNVTQLSQHYSTHAKEVNTRDDLVSMGLYIPSSYMQSLRIKYQVGFEI